MHFLKISMVMAIPLGLASAVGYPGLIYKNSDDCQSALSGFVDINSCVDTSGIKSILITEKKIECVGYSEMEDCKEGSAATVLEWSSPGCNSALEDSLKPFKAIKCVRL
ncbi:hypothetical protein V496_03644 [Pseudogymnoascus sp. VKM F-4515 (FW-2607)]|nr:hypothetical protein V496_03644 [Pseudogymnoascus sp. VKM F-4515 (FW-2607)]